MLLPLASTPNPSLLIIECGLTGIAVASSFAWPRLGAGGFARIERTFARLARRQGLSVAVVGLSVVLLRLAILPLFASSAAVCSRRFQLSARQRHLCSRPAGQSNPRDVDAFRKHPHHHAADLSVDVLSRAGTASCRQHGRLRASVGRPADRERAHVRGDLLDAAGMAAAELGAAGRVPGRAAPGRFQLLDQHLPRRGFAGCAGRSADPGRPAAFDEDVAVPLCDADGHRHRDSCPDAALRRHSALPAGRVCARPLDVEGQEPAQRRQVCAPGCCAAGDDDCRRRVAGLLRLSRLRQPAHSALRGRSRHLRHCSVLRLAAAAARAQLPLCRDARVLSQRGAGFL